MCITPEAESEARARPAIAEWTDDAWIVPWNRGMHGGMRHVPPGVTSGSWRRFWYDAVTA